MIKESHLDLHLEKRLPIIIDKIGKATLATATNVFAHVQDLGDFLRGQTAIKEMVIFALKILLSSIIKVHNMTLFITNI